MKRGSDMIVNVKRILHLPRRKDGALAYRLADGVVDAVRAVDGESAALRSLLEGEGDALGDVQRTLIKAELSLLSSRREVLMCRFKDLGGRVRPMAEVVMYESEDERRKVEGDDWQ